MPDKDSHCVGHLATGGEEPVSALPLLLAWQNCQAATQRPPDGRRPSAQGALNLEDPETVLEGGACGQGQEPIKRWGGNRARLPGGPRGRSQGAHLMGDSGGQM